jgi:hypothetical protein
MRFVAGIPTIRVPERGGHQVTVADVDPQDDRLEAILLQPLARQRDDVVRDAAGAHAASLPGDLARRAGGRLRPRPRPLVIRSRARRSAAGNQRRGGGERRGEL